jgi:primosomal protein N' (replication factor Y) (superfamily II helicase)
LVSNALPLLTVDPCPVASEATMEWPRPDLADPAWIEVLVDCPGAQGLFTYRLTPELSVQPGDILAVPFGSHPVGGIAIRYLSQPPADIEPDKIRPVEDVICRGFFPVQYWQLLEQVAKYYQTPLIQAVKVALPPGLLQRSQRRVRLVDPPETGLPETDATAQLTFTISATPTSSYHPSQHLGLAAQKLLYLLQQNPQQDYSWRHLQQQVPQAQRGLRELRQRGWVESYLKPTPAKGLKQQLAVTLLTQVAEQGQDLTPRQQEILEHLHQQGGQLWQQDLLQQCRTTPNTIRTLAQKGCVEVHHRTRLRLDQSGAAAGQMPQTLTPAQAQALAALDKLQGYEQVLLHGVTGSGKTEVYLQAIAKVHQQGQSALVLVPEIGLTPQLTDRFRARFGDHVCVYHSALGDGERYDTWHHLLSPNPHVVIGTRSAVFAPLSNVGLIILDEEHDPGFKQDQPAPCYHARMVAQWRAEAADCPLILGSATPALETWARLRSSSYYLSLPERVQARPLPPIQVVDMRDELHNGNRSIFSRTLTQALQELQERREQGLLFIHRRGHSTFVSCRSCGYVMECPNCSVSLTYHFTQEKQARLRCHYCNFTCFLPKACPDCQSPYFKFFGSGTQRVEHELAKLFPELRLIRFDSDTTQAKGAHRQFLDAFARGEADLLVGTQMLTKGIDLPQVKLVGVLAADSLLNLPDFRAGERTFQTLTQVAGRAGRGEEPGRVILQTYTPDHPVIQAVQDYRCEAFLTDELQQREGLCYPPYGQLLLLRLSGFEAQQLEATAFKLADYLRDYFHQPTNPPDPTLPAIEVLGPAPANIFRVARRYRWQILLKRSFDTNIEGTSSEQSGQSEQSTPIPLPLSALRKLCSDKVRLSIDVDPLNLL